MRRFITIIFSFVLYIFIITESASAEKIRATFLHINDIYEIGAVQGGTRGGLARVATIQKSLKRLNPNTFTVLTGDCVGPSAIGTAVVDGKPLAGRQMIAVLNALPIDFATFGNHEFDLSEEELKERVKESKFQWFSSNVRTPAGDPFLGVPGSKILKIRGTKGKVFSIGLIAITLDSNPKPYVQYLDPIITAREQVEKLRGKVDAIIALTHLTIEEDIALAESVSEIDAIIGGHEHDNIQLWRGSRPTPILKGDANARSVYILDAIFDTNSRSVSVTPRLQLLNESISEDKGVLKVVSEWSEKGFKAFRERGFIPEETVAQIPVALEGRETMLRNHATNLGELIADSILGSFPEGELSFYNSGSVRIDDVIQPGPLTQYDVIRILPFGGETLLVGMKGTLIERALDAGVSSRGKGGFLQFSRVERGPEGWLINGKSIEPNREYKVASNDFLLSGREPGFEFLKDNSGISGRLSGPDVRVALINELRGRWPSQ